MSPLNHSGEECTAQLIAQVRATSPSLIFRESNFQDSSSPMVLHTSLPFSLNGSAFFNYNIPYLNTWIIEKASREAYPR